MAQGDHWRMQLNNLMQRSYGLGALNYVPAQTGPQHTAPWVVIAYIRGIEYGRGTAHTQADAKEQAAYQAFHGLMAELNRPH